MKKQLTVLLILNFVFINFINAQSLDEILKKHYEARGGLKNIKSTETIQLIGKTLMMGKEFPTTIYQKRTGGYRSEMKMGERSIIQAYDRKIGWQIIPMAGTLDPIDIKGKELQSIKEQADIDGYLIDWKEKNYKLELVGKEKLKDTEVYRIKIICSDTTEKNLYLDAKSYLLLQRSEKLNMRGKEVEVITTYGEYKKVEKIMMPFFEEVSGGMPQKIQYEKIILNKPISDSLFVKPNVITK